MRYAKQFLFLVFCSLTFQVLGQNGRTPVKQAGPTQVNLQAEPRLQTAMNRLQESLKVPSEHQSNKLMSLLFTTDEFRNIFVQTYQKEPAQSDLEVFEAQKNSLISTLDLLRAPDVKVQILKINERSGDNSLRALVPYVQFKGENLNKIVRFVMLKYNQEYKIMMIDE